jgi:photosystem II stability/assembly factor-like uncharacterized protein
MTNVVRALLLLPLILLAAVSAPAYVQQTLAADASGQINRQDSPLAAPTPAAEETDPSLTPEPTAPPADKPQPPSLAASMATASSVDAAATVLRVSNLNIHRVVGDRLSPTLYGLAENGWLYRSSNDGRTWSLATTAPLVRDFTMNAGNPHVLYGGAGLDCGAPGQVSAPLFRSSDGGSTWVMLRTGMNLRPLLTNPADPDMVFAADCAMIYLSTDGGRTWTAKPDLSAATLWNQYAVADMSAAALVGDPRPQQPDWFQLFALGVDAEERGVAAFTGELGDTWVEITAHAPANPGVIVAHQTQAGRLWLLAADGVWTTTNYGIDWELLNAGLPPHLFAGGLHDLTYGTDGALYLATDLGLYTLPPGEQIWRRVTIPGGERRSMERLLLTESSPNQLWVNTDEGVLRVFVGEGRD